MEEVVTQRNLSKYIKVSHKVIGANWDPSRSKWRVTIVTTDGRELVVADGKSKEGETGAAFCVECDVLINAGGAYNNWKWPQISNLQSFKGQLLHSAAWPKNTSINNQVVALIGNGSSGIQILPAILEQVKKVYVFIRSPTWITAGFASKYAGPDGDNITYSEEQQRSWAEDPDAYLLFRKMIEDELNIRFPLYINHSEAQAQARDYAEEQMHRRLQKVPDMAANLIPSFPVG